MSGKEVALALAASAAGTAAVAWAARWAQQLQRRAADAEAAMAALQVGARLHGESHS
jgi:hypothetical protein